MRWIRTEKYCTYMATDCLRRDERKQTDYHLDIMSELRTHIKSLLGIPLPNRLSTDDTHHESATPYTYAHIFALRFSAHLHFIFLVYIITLNRQTIPLGTSCSAVWLHSIYLFRYNLKTMSIMLPLVYRIVNK